MNKVVDDIKKYGSVQRVMLSIQGSDVLNYINNQKENGKEVNLGTNEGVYIANGLHTICEVVSESRIHEYGPEKRCRKGVCGRY